MFRANEELFHSYDHFEVGSDLMKLRGPRMQKFEAIHLERCSLSVEGWVDKKSVLNRFWTLTSDAMRKVFVHSDAVEESVQARVSG